MAPKIRNIVLLTDATLGEVRHPKGVAFKVVDKLPAQLGPGEVDPATARSWERMVWAEEVKSGGKTERANDAD